MWYQFKWIKLTNYQASIVGRSLSETQDVKELKYFFVCFFVWTSVLAPVWLKMWIFLIFDWLQAARSGLESLDFSLSINFYDFSNFW